LPSIPRTPKIPLLLLVALGRRLRKEFGAHDPGTLLPPSSIVFDNVNFGIDITLGDYTWTWGPEPDQSFTIDALPLSTSTTPLPAALPQLATGLGALGLLGRRTKRTASASLLGVA
jgi:hypothetical protein